jgi:hypothetical protein
MPSEEKKSSPECAQHRLCCAARHSKQLKHQQGDRMRDMIITVLCVNQADTHWMSSLPNQIIKQYLSQCPVICHAIALRSPLAFDLRQ